MSTDLTIGIAGAGGDGVIVLGELLARAAARSGLHASLSKSFGPQIRGGETSARIRVCDHPLSGADHRVDALFCFHLADMASFASELPLSENTEVYVDAIDTSDPADSPLPEFLHGRVARIPFDELALSRAGSKQAKNMVMAGAIAQLYGWPDALLADLVRARFRRHPAVVAENNLKAMAAGREFAADHFVTPRPRAVAFTAGQPNYFMSGNEALSLGALAAGCRFMAGYPISPASEILEFMSRELPRFGGVCQQGEDEISAVCMAIGASYGGARAMTATSGPGFSLKQEAIGLASMAELPLVVVDVQRCGPSTGIPTRTEQADLNIAIHGAHGDAPRVVLAATDVRSCYELAYRSFEIAERFQLPVILLSDQLLAQSQISVDDLPAELEDVDAALPWRRLAAGEELDGRFGRYSLAHGAVAPSSVPGIAGGEYVAVGIEHNEHADPSSSPAMHQAQTERRFAKLTEVAQQYPLVRVAGSDQPQLTLLTWGSCWGVCDEAARLLGGAGVAVRVVAPELLHPLPVAQLEALLRSAGEVVVVEANYTGQLFRHLRAHLDLPAGTRRLSRAGGVPISLLELVSFIREQVDLPASFDHSALQQSLNS